MCVLFFTFAVLNFGSNPKEPKLLPTLQNIVLRHYSWATLAKASPSNQHCGLVGLSGRSMGVWSFQLPRVIEGGVGVNNLKPPLAPYTVPILPTSNGNAPGTLGKHSPKKKRNFMKKFHKRGGGVNRISYLLFRNTYVPETR